MNRSLETGGQPQQGPEIVLDLSRLVSRFRHEAPTGVDRVEMAYARELLRRIPERLSFAAVHPAGKIYGRLSPRAVVRFLARTEAEWRDGKRPATGRLARWWDHIGLLWSLRPRRIPRRTRSRVLVQSSPHHLHNEEKVARILAREGAAFVCLLHDLIPVEFPEYAREGGDQLHRRRIGTIVRHAAAVVANSRATLDSFLPHLAAAGRSLPAVVAHLGLDPGCAPPSGVSATGGRPFFVCVGTIEPRKNHLLLLHVWRRMAETYGADAVPKLVIVGRRGWENEQVVDLLERCTILRGCVEERGRVSDGVMHHLISSARALLLPSFAEGYGMPVPEALLAGVPVICSDLPALREAGGLVPDYLDPLDGPAWIEAVLAYAQPRSERREAQSARMQGWTPPSWADHLSRVVALADEVAS